MPSAVSRRRLQLKQKCSLTGVIKPMVPLALGSLKYLAGPLPALGKQGSSLPSLSIVFFISLAATKWGVLFSPFTGISSIKRTCHSSSMVLAAKSSTSSSLTPGITTMLSLTGSSPTPRAASMPSSTSASSASLRVMDGNLSGLNVSRLMLTLFSPAFFSSAAYLASMVPLVVSEMSFMVPIPASIATRSDNSALTSGSPPVSLILSIPISAAALAMVLISS